MATIALPATGGTYSSEPLPMLAQALCYAKRGWLVIPLHAALPNGCSCESPKCTRPGKHPRTRNGLKNGSTETKLITNWWQKWPDANIGILTGPESGICVLDVDGEEGLKALAELSNSNDLPATLTALTGRQDSLG